MSEEFWPERGLWQGDPLSPYLFLLCTEWFAQKLRQGQEENRLRGIKICRDAPEVTHLLFADDSVIFLRANMGDATNLKSILTTYEDVSGQKINVAKSEICFSKNVPAELKEGICRVLDMRQVDRFSKYLGLPVSFSNNKTEAFKFIVDRIWQKVQGWKEQTLSMAGKEVLIKSILQAVSTYAMMCFKLPESLCKRILGIVSRYWWNNKGGGKCVYWGSYKLLCRSKEIGGLGLRDFESFNDAMLANRPSFAWRSLWNAKNKVRQWISLEGTTHRPVRSGQDSGEFSVRSAYGMRKKLSEMSQTNVKGEQASIDKTQSFWRRIWRLKVQPKVKFFAWRAFHNFLPWAVNLVRRNCGVGMDCQICGWKRETTTHILLHCWWARAYWESSGIDCGFLDFDFREPGDWLWFCASKFSDKELAIILYGARQIWFNRNLVVNECRGLNPFVEAANSLEVIQWSLKPESSFVVTTLTGDGSWKPPEDGYIKVNVDGAWDRESGKAGVGLCCRDIVGLVLGVEAEPVPYLASSFEAEVLSMKRSLEMAERLKFNKVIFELDSAEVFNVLQGRSSLVGRVAGWITSCRIFLGRHPGWFLNLVPREANSVADKIAKKAKGEDWIWRNPDAIPFVVV